VSLVVWLLSAFGLSAITDLRVLVLLAVLAPVLFWRGCGRAGRRTLSTVAPTTSIVVLASWGWLAVIDRQLPAWQPFVALVLRALLISFLSFSMLVVTLAQIHALRLLYAESRLGLQSRLLRRPSARDLLRGAAGITGALFTMATRNAREIGEAMRSRGF
jgi:cobalt/nickel transport system permease protein